MIITKLLGTCFIILLTFSLSLSAAPSANDSTFTQLTESYVDAESDGDKNAMNKLRGMIIARISDAISQAESAGAEMDVIRLRLIRKRYSLNKKEYLENLHTKYRNAVKQGKLEEQKIYREAIVSNYNRDKEQEARKAVLDARVMSLIEDTMLQASRSGDDGFHDMLYDMSKQMRIRIGEPVPELKKQQFMLNIKKGMVKALDQENMESFRKLDGLLTQLETLEIGKQPLRVKPPTAESVTSLEEKLRIFFKENKIGRTTDYAFIKNSFAGKAYLITIHGYADNKSVCEKLVQEYNDNPELSTIKGQYSCEPLN